MNLKNPYLVLVLSLFLSSCLKKRELQQVTVGQFEAFVSETGYVTDAEKFGWSIVQKTVYYFETVPGATWEKPDGTTLAKRDNPVTQVSYNDAQAYAEWAKATLPTYDEFWEIARNDERRVNVFYDSILPARTVNLIGNVWEITKPQSDGQIRLAGGSFLCSPNTCDGTNRNRELMVDQMTGNVHVGFAILK